MYQIRNGEVYENENPTGVKAFYSKYEIAEAYNWSISVCKKRLNEIAHKIYDFDNQTQQYRNRKKQFTPNEMCIIFNHFGLP